MLNDLLDELGYLGDGVGEKLKSVSRGDLEVLIRRGRDTKCETEWHMLELTSF